MGLLGEKFRVRAPQNLNTRSQRVSTKSLEDYDQEALQAAQQFRSSGVFIGFLGLLVTTLAILPSGIDFDHHTVLILTALKVSLMIAIILLIFKHNRSNIKDKWLFARIKAEQLRYGWLKNDQIDLQEVTNLIDSQISYNHSKIERYESVEHTTELLTWVAFGLALIAATAHFLIEAHWLIFFTGLFPALVGILHGINGFLGFGAMIRDHEYALSSLKGIQERILQPNMDIKSIANELFWLMSMRDSQWLKLVESTKHMPA